MADQTGTWVNIGAGLAEFVAPGEKCSATVNAERERSRAIFDAKVRTHGYVDRVTGERIYDPDALGVSVDRHQTFCTGEKAEK